MGYWVLKAHSPIVKVTKIGKRKFKTKEDAEKFFKEIHKKIPFYAKPFIKGTAIYKKD